MKNRFGEENAMNSQKKYQILPSLVCLSPIPLGLALYDRLPDLLPRHFNFQGVADAYSPKLTVILLLPLLLWGSHLLIQWFASKDASLTGKTKTVIQWTCPVLSVVMGISIYRTALTGEGSMGDLFFVLMGLMFIPLGLYAPKLQPNGIVGIRLPWTMKSRENWDKTHRMARPLWIGGGAASIPLAAVGLGRLWMVVLVIIILVPGVYSYLLYRKGV